MSATISRSARCNCGDVEITVTGVDKSAVHCYCLNCKRATGTAFAHNHRFVKAELQYHRGQDVVKQYADGTTDSGNVMYRHFCSTCGSPMFLKSLAVPDFIALHEGSILEEKTQPTIELYPQDKYPWIGDVTSLCHD
ncbi:hypothetical protein LTR09_005499 [Extremus antarcticus]|uniref:CENP-V/GFA domain-containing protein n=1 Tax=Extremus antarcticus TaxID=702011 RepID=A0AAJ0DFY1_9PEZI|nr:hypothetical protein LTR09_005499 [Extremus antarcticus]